MTTQRQFEIKQGHFYLSKKFSIIYILDLDVASETIVAKRDDGVAFTGSFGDLMSGEHALTREIAPEVDWEESTLQFQERTFPYMHFCDALIRNDKVLSQATPYRFSHHGDILLTRQAPGEITETESETFRNINLWLAANMKKEEYFVVKHYNDKEIRHKSEGLSSMDPYLHLQDGFRIWMKSKEDLETAFAILADFKNKMENK